jgi:hypothetical protein
LPIRNSGSNSQVEITPIIKRHDLQIWKSVRLPACLPRHVTPTALPDRWRHARV